MNRQEFEDTAKRYREELFRMYASQNITPQPKPQPAAVPAQNLQPVPEPPEPEIRPAPVPQPAAESDNLPEIGEPAMPKREYTGIIRVHVSTGRGARPVAGATVIITHITTGEPELISLQTTDESGNISAVTVPAPPPSEDQRHPQSFLYDITAQAAGYYREHSTDVPVFPNVTSIQDFDMIPLPAGSEEPVSAGDITFFNEMQQY
ncbi:MAG: carboxypeptidase regulatory-like domain-containing protein [Oscillospiraceae bacterium]|nr:carboxypeptidase regulatory-like domain-containing protein [Oscillospiraceae bacterium]